MYNASALLGRGHFEIETITVSGSGQSPLWTNVSESVSNDSVALTDTIRVTPRAGGMYRVVYVTDDGCRYGSDDAVFVVTCNAEPDASATESTYTSQWEGLGFAPVALNATTSTDADQDSLDLTWELDSVQFFTADTVPSSPFPALGSPEHDINVYSFRPEVLAPNNITLGDSAAFASGGTSGIASLTPRFLGRWGATAKASDRCSDDST